MPDFPDNPDLDAFIFDTLGRDVKPEETEIPPLSEAAPPPPAPPKPPMSTPETPEASPPEVEPEPTADLAGSPTADPAANPGADPVRSRLLRYAYMKLARDFDARFEYLLKTGRVSKWYSEVGNEATTVPAGLALEPGDALCTLHRDLGAILAVYLDPVRTFPEMGFEGLLPRETERRPEPVALLRRLSCQLLGKGEGFSQGVERSFHYGYLAPDEDILHVGMISHLGSMIPVAAGCAFALQRSGGDRVAVNFIGDGGTSTGDFHEGLNMAAVWKLPLILVIENNRYAFSTPTALQYAADKLSDRGIGYGIAAETVDGNDPDAVAEAMERAVARARAGDGPTLIEAMLGRMRGHSEGDDSLKVVPENELQGYLAEDPVPNTRKRLLADGVMDLETSERLDRRIAGLVAEALDQALEAAPPDPETAFRSVFAPAVALPGGSTGEPEVAPAETLDEEPSNKPSDKPWEAPSALARPAGGALTTYVEAVTRALRQEMESDESVVLLGQDIGIFEGAFRVTRGFHESWPERVLDTPIAESGTIGIAVGAALLGFRPVVEMQFADFISCGFNQLVNVAAKLYYRWQVPVPLVVRLPSGGGVGAGPFHSQNPEGWFAHTGGIKVVCPATAADAGALLRASVRDPNPVVFCEHKFLYRRIKEELPEEIPVGELGRARVMREGKHLSLIAYGASTWVALEVAEELAKEGIEAEVIDLRTLVPLDEETVLASVKKTGRAMIVHEALLTGGFGAEVAARVSDAAFQWLDAPIRRVAYPDRPSPFSKVLEQALMPDKEKVLAAARELMAF